MKPHALLPAAAFIAIVVMGGVAAASDNGYSVSLGYEHSSGDYGLDSKTETDYVPLTVSYEGDRWLMDLTIPWVRLKGYGTVVVTRQGPLQMSATPGSGMYSTHGSGRYASGSGTTTTTTTVVKFRESGLGDITLALGYDFSGDIPNGPETIVTGIIKFPTADETKGLGTGEADYSLELYLSMPVASFTPFMTAGYTVTGDTDAISYNDFFYGSAGCSYAISDVFEIGAAYNMNGKLTDQSDDGRSVSAYIDASINDTWSLSLSAEAGLTDATADTTYGVELSAAF